MTKQFITELKQRSCIEIANLIDKHQDIGSINFILENLGQLPKNFEGSFLYDLLNHKHSQVRLNAVKNVGKLNGKANIEKLVSLYKTEKDTSVRREIVSSIGRQRKQKTKRYCLNF